MQMLFYGVCVGVEDCKYLNLEEDVKEDTPVKLCINLELECYSEHTMYQEKVSTTIIAII